MPVPTGAPTVDEVLVTSKFGGWPGTWNWSSALRLASVYWVSPWMAWSRAALVALTSCA
jgi:hypothetical protein